MVSPGQTPSDTGDTRIKNAGQGAVFVGALLPDCCEIHPDAKVPRRALFGAYERWAKTEGVRHPLTKRSFAIRVRARLAVEFGPRHVADLSVSSAGTSPVDGWRGISIKTDEVAHAEAVN
jgi:hypothetical protein